MSRLTHPIQLLRSISSELRHSLPEGTNIQQSQSMGYILSMYKKNVVTQEQYCKHQEEMTFMAETYLTYLSKTLAEFIMHDIPSYLQVPRGPGMLSSKSSMPRGRELLPRQPRWWGLTCHMSQRCRGGELLRRNKQRA